ncbi:MAG: SAM-dependent methyltransferase [Aeromicrobium sp.]|nr:SAM-dependent methyltransferase [Aeromicrobium sp.]MCW2790475.1 SAM-dependent methyltransferase [Aeromicrobium sp.]
MTHEPSPVVASQNESHGEGHDYVKGSPHLRHETLRSMIADRLRELVQETVRRQGACHVLEVGAGHGTFTDFLIQAGASVTVTEASEASAAHLTARYADHDSVNVFYDRTGEDIFTTPTRFDAVVCASLLHHVPDYVTFVRRLAGLLAPDGWFYSAQDPTYYPRRSRATHLASRGTYFAWRVGQGNMRRGLATHLRRFRGEWSDTEPSDLVEYHVMRDGVDELALERELRRWYADVELITYWSTQAPIFQRLLARAGLASDFCLVARSRTAAQPD